MRMVRPLLLGLIGLIGFLGLPGIAMLAAQDPVYTVRVDVGLVSLDVTVMDSQHQPITSLRERDFTILEDGVEQDIKNFSTLDVPYNILLLFDRSASTEDQWRTM